VGAVYCTVGFFAYLYYQVKYASQDPDMERSEKIEQVCMKAIAGSVASFAGLYAQELERQTSKDLSATEALNAPNRIKAILSKFFNKYDTDKSGSIDLAELTALLIDLNEDPCVAPEVMKEMDSDKSGEISFDEFCAAMTTLIKRRPSQKLTETDSLQIATSQASAAEDDDEEEDIMPDDLAELSPEDQQKRIKMRSAWMMLLGTSLVLLFSDPMVDVLSGFGGAIGIKPFYVAFVLAPLASNASEILSAAQYAAKRTRATMTISLSTLQGAACMNNTLCLGIFLALMYFRHLPWEFSAETISILLIEVCMAYYSLRTTYRVLDGLVILSLFPLAILIVHILEDWVGLN